MSELLEHVGWLSRTGGEVRQPPPWCCILVVWCLSVGECCGLSVVGALSTVMSLRGGQFLQCVPVVVRGDCVCSFSVFFAFALDARV